MNPDTVNLLRPMYNKRWAQRHKVHQLRVDLRRMVFDDQCWEAHKTVAFFCDTIRVLAQLQQQDAEPHLQWVQQIRQHDVRIVFAQLLADASRPVRKKHD